MVIVELAVWNVGFVLAKDEPSYSSFKLKTGSLFWRLDTAAMSSARISFKTTDLFMVTELLGRTSTKSAGCGPFGSIVMFFSFSNRRVIGN